jgi:8-oxo-dGTP pyrophosphatase MutT (NUDIX family)
MNRSGLVATVAGFAAADSVEQAHLDSLTALIQAVPDPWWRHRYNPGHVTASAFVLHPEETAMALVHHAALDLWVQPGGHIESSDPDHESAARREVVEEIGIGDLDTIGVLDVDIHVFPERGGQPQHLHLDLRWAFRARSPLLEAGEGTRAARWVPLAEAAGMDESIARPARKLLDRLA